MKNLDKILVPTDFSENAEKALSYAIEFGIKTQAHLVLFHAYTVPMATGSGHFEAAVQEPPKMDYETVAKEQLEKLEKETPALKNVSYELKTEAGFAVDAITEYVDQNDIDLIIMGTQGASGLKEYLIGSNTASIIEEAGCAVMAIPQETQYKTINNIALAYDHEKINDPERFDMLKTIAAINKAEIHIITITSDLKPKPYKDFTSLDEFEQYFSDIKHLYNLQLNDDTEKGINEYVSAHNIDMVAVMPREHGFFESIFKKSVSKKLAYHTNVPLLAI